MVVIYGLLFLLAGLGVFLYGIHNVGQGMERVASSSIKKNFNVLTNNSFKSFSAGVVSTMLVQSSSVATIMYVGLINVGMIKLRQALLMILGASIGATVILLLFCFEIFHIVEIFALLTLIGASVVMFCKSNISQRIGKTIAGFGMLFCGLKIMSVGMGDITSLDSVQNYLTNLTSPIILLLLGFVLGIGFHTLGTTALVISLMSLYSDGGQSLSMLSGATIVLSAHVGSTLVSLLASVNGNHHAKRAALYYLFITFTTSLIMAIVIYATPWLSWGMNIFGRESLVIIITLIVMAFVNALIHIPLIPLSEKLLMKIIRNKKQSVDEKDLVFEMDDEVLRSAELSRPQIILCILRLSNLTKNTTNRTYKEIFDSVESERIYTRRLSGKIKELIKKTQHNILQVNDALNSNHIERFNAYSNVLYEFNEIVDYNLKIQDYFEIIPNEETKFVASELDLCNEMNELINNIFDKIDLIFNEEFNSGQIQTELYEDDIFAIEAKFADLKTASKKILYKKMKCVESIDVYNKHEQVFFLLNRMSEIADHLSNLAIKAK